MFWRKLKRIPEKQQNTRFARIQLWEKNWKFSIFDGCLWMNRTRKKLRDIICLKNLKLFCCVDLSRSPISESLSACERCFYSGGKFWTIRYRSIFEQSIWFLIQAKDETPYFLMIKVFCPLKSFLPPFLRIENLKILSFQKSDL